MKAQSMSVIIASPVPLELCQCNYYLHYYIYYSLTESILQFFFVFSQGQILKYNILQLQYVAIPDKSAALTVRLSFFSGLQYLQIDKYTYK